MPAPVRLDPHALRAEAPQADLSGQLGPAQQAFLHRHLRMLVPQALGGSERPLPEVVRFEEELARIDGSTAWVFTLCAGALWFAGFLEPATARTLLAAENVCWAGSGALGGHATRDGEGWRLHGEWPFASGAPLATHFTLNARLADGSQRAFIVPAAQVRRLPGSWRALGLRATASEAFALDRVWVPDAHSFELRPETATADGPLYRFPFSGLAHATLAANLSGLALQVLDEAAPLIERPRAAHLRALLAQEQAALDTARTPFYAALDAAWPQGDDRALNPAALALVAQARRTVAAVYAWCGLRAADPAEPLNRAWRDFHTASQHAIWLPPCATG